MKIKKILMLFVVLMLSAISVFAQNVENGRLEDRKYGVLYDRDRNIIGYTDAISPYTILGNPNYTSGIIKWNDEIIIKDGAFKSCSKLTEVIIDKCIIAIENDAFSHCTSLTKVSISESVKSIGKYAFKYCRSLTELTIPEGVTTIEEEVFRNCSSLTKLTIPEGVTTIGKGAFRGCTNLTTISIPESVTSIGEDAFKGTKCFLGVTHKKTNNSVTVSDIPDQTYTGSKIKPEITVLYKSTALVLGTDFTIRYIGNIESGTATVIITGIGDYEGMDFKQFNINRKTLEASNVKDIPDQPFTGSALKPSVTVVDRHNLKLNTDYTVSYTNNTNVGTATATITGKGNYSGKVEKTFTITPKVSDLGALTLTEDQNGIAAVIDGNSTESLSIDSEDGIEVKSVTYSRTFIADGGAYTIMLPFGFTVTSDIKGTFHTLGDITPLTETVWKAEPSSAITEIQANTPYIFKPSEDIDKMLFENVTLKATTSPSLTFTNACENTNWKLHGVYSQKVWTDADGNEYGFAAAAQGEISVGEFVHFVTGATLKATRCYLEYSEDGFSKSAVVLPEKIIVVFPENNNGEIITPVSEITPSNGTNVWSADKKIVIESKAGDQYRIIDLNGRTLRESRLTADREEVTLSRTAGIVIVKINGKTFKINY